MIKPLRILLLENDPYDAELILFELKRSGFVFEWERLEAEAEYQRYLQENDVDIILADYSLPQFNALQALLHLQETGKNIPFLVISGTISEEIAVECMKLGAADYLLKDRLARLGSAVKQALMQKQLHEENLQAIEALQQREQEFKALVENAQDIIARFDRNLRYLYVNPVVETAIGVPPSSFIGKTDREMGLVEQLIDTWEERLQRVFTTGREEAVEFNFVINEELKHYHFRLVPELAPDGKVESILSIGRDLTARVHAQTEASRLAAVIEQAAEAVIITNLAGEIVYVNPHFEMITGYKAAEVIGKRPQILQSGQQDRAFYKRLWERITSGGVWQGTFVNKRKDGSFYYAEASIFPVKNQAGQLINFAAVQRDVTERRRIEREREAIIKVAATLRQASNRAEMLTLIMEQLIDILNVDGTALAIINPETDELVFELVQGMVTELTDFRLPRGEGVSWTVIESGEPYLNNDPGSDSRLYLILRMRRQIQGVACIPLITEEKVIGVLWLMRKAQILAKEMRLFSAIGDMVASAINRATLHEQVLRHAAELEQHVAERTQELAKANDQLKELDRLKTKFVSNVSHELRTPLSNLKLYLDLLKLSKPEKHERYQHVLDEQVERLAQLIEDILNLSRLEVGFVQPVDFKPLNLNDITDAVVKDHAMRAEASGLQLSFTPQEELPPVRGERSQLTQIVTNLVKNALHYTEIGYVRVKTHFDQQAEKVCLQVEDSGPGISPEDVPHLFQRFYRGHNASQSDKPGSGLGLAIVKEAVAIHGGQVELETEVGIGTTFRIWLPAAGGEEKTQEETPSAQEKEG